MNTTPAGKYDVIGVMSGTSLDGLDIAWCRFYFREQSIEYEILQSTTIRYDAEWIERLTKAHLLSAKDFLLLHQDFGTFIGKHVRQIMDLYSVSPFCVASHGHTIFHEPSEQFTFQIGHGAFIAAQTGVDVITDFRVLDVAMGGQGAPLVSYGDILLFHEYEATLNLGGFANITILDKKHPRAFDICPVNFVLNHFSRKAGMEYDNNGMLASTGKIHVDLLEILEKNEFYRIPGSHSLSREWVEKHVFSAFSFDNVTMADILRTLNEHIARRITDVFHTFHITRCLVTGGGVYNTFLINRIEQLSSCRLIIPNQTIIEYKEALIFALLGLLRKLERYNILGALTGSYRNISSGVLWKGSLL